MSHGGKLKVDGIVGSDNIAIHFQDSGAGLPPMSWARFPAVLFHQGRHSGTGAGFTHLPQNSGALCRVSIVKTSLVKAPG